MSSHRICNTGGAAIMQVFSFTIMIYVTLTLAEVKEGREREKRAISVKAFYSAASEGDRECPYKQTQSYEFDLMGTLASLGFRLASNIKFRHSAWHLIAHLLVHRSLLDGCPRATRLREHHTVLEYCLAVLQMCWPTAGGFLSVVLEEGKNLCDSETKILRTSAFLTWYSLSY